jgi:hypothetical protein
VEFADVELVAFFDAFCIDAVAFVFNAVCGIEILNIIRAIFEDHGAVFSRNIAIADDEIGQL